MDSTDLKDKVALVTGGSNGIGTGVARRLAAAGARVVIADIDDVRGPEVAAEVGGLFVRTDVRSLAELRSAAAAATEAYGGIDVAFLNAGISTGCGVGDDFDEEAYHRANGINLDGVVFGVHAVLPSIRERKGAIIATASLAGLTAVPFDPIYGANKHAVVGLVRGLGSALEPEGITVNALCPSFAKTAIIEPLQELLETGGVPLLEVEEVVDAFMAILGAGRTGECWWVQPGRPSAPFRFGGVPGPRVHDASAPALDVAAATAQTAAGA